MIGQSLEESSEERSEESLLYQFIVFNSFSSIVKTTIEGISKVRVC